MAGLSEGKPATIATPTGRAFTEVIISCIHEPGRSNVQRTVGRVVTPPDQPAAYAETAVSKQVPVRMKHGRTAITNRKMSTLAGSGNIPEPHPIIARRSQQASVRAEVNVENPTTLTLLS